MSVMVLTRVRVDPDAIDELAELFRSTNRALVADQPDWLGAWFTADRERGEITNIAHWRRAESYQRLRGSEAFRATMSRFAERFTAPPEVTIHEVLVEMAP
jgi:heme-degrading monooxygenase HmoA